MTSREIIIDLINKQIIDGEMAFTLINDLLQSELMESWKILNTQKFKENTLTWNGFYNSTVTPLINNDSAVTIGALKADSI